MPLAACRAEAASDGTIRVAIADGIRSVQVGGDGIRVTDLRGRPLLGQHAPSVSVRLANGALDLGGRRVSGARLRASDSGALRLNGREYPGVLDVLKNGHGLLVVNEVPFEEYLAGVVKAEAKETWAIEMLKAQAIAARTYAAYHRELNDAKPFHILASKAHQQYIGRVSVSSPVWQAVRATAGRVLSLGGQLFPAFYHTDSGGYTEEPRLVFTSKHMPPLRAVRSEFSGDSPYFAWNLDISLAELSRRLRKAGVSVGTIRRLEVLKRSPSLRVLRLAVHGTRRTAWLSGADFRRMLGYDTLRSTLFSVAVDGRYARFSGRGYGHGVGMDQWGAKAMAERGYTALEILRYYYPGAVPRTLR